MNRIFSNVFVFLALAVMGLNSSVLVEGSGVVKTESRKVSTFTSIDVSGTYDVEIFSQQPPSLEISGDKNILPLIITEVRGNTLFIYSQQNICVKNRLSVKVSSHNIEKISVSGANNIKLSRVNNENLNIAQSGSAKTEVFGKTKNLYITISGAVDLDAKNLYSKKVKVDISGAANANVYATEDLTVSVFGAGNVNYYGNPKNVIRSISGIGSINKK